MWGVAAAYEGRYRARESARVHKLFLQAVDVRSDVVQVGAGYAGHGLHLALSFSNHLLDIGGAFAERLHFHLHHLRDGRIALPIGAMATLTFGVENCLASRRIRRPSAGGAKRQNRTYDGESYSGSQLLFS